jgi:hypothetical protein
VTYNIEAVESLIVQSDYSTVEFNKDVSSDIIKEIYDQVSSTIVQTCSKSKKENILGEKPVFIIIIKYRNEITDSIYLTDQEKYLYKKQHTANKLLGGINREIYNIIDKIIQAEINKNDLNQHNTNQSVRSNSVHKEEYPDISNIEDHNETEQYNEYDLECPDCEDQVYYFEKFIDEVYCINKEMYILVCTFTEKYSENIREELYDQEKNQDTKYIFIMDTIIIEITDNFELKKSNDLLINNNLIDSIINVCKNISGGNITEDVQILKRSDYLEKKIDVAMIKDTIGYFSYTYNDGNTKVYLDRVYNEPGIKKEFEKLKCFQGCSNNLIVVSSFSSSVPVTDWGIRIQTEDIYFITDKIPLESQ